MEKFFSLEIILEEKMPEYEIEIADYLKIFWENKWLILFGTLLLVIITGGISLFLPKTYESIGIVQLGKIEGTLIDTPNIIRARIEYNPYPEMFIESSGMDISKKDFLVNMETRGNAGFFRLTVKGSSPDITSKYIQYIVDDIATSHMERITKFREHQDQNAKDLESRIASLEKSINEMEEIARSKPSTVRTNVERFILENALAGKENLLMNLKTRYAALKISDVTAKTFPTSLLFLRTPPNPSKPKVKLNLLVAMIVGLMIFMAISLFLEYNKRERHNNRDKT
jgi:uncharacterized protein involved in exopolysaccharide biosynthesis